MYRAILCDDDEIILEGLKYFMERQMPDIHLIAAASNGASCISYIKEYKPDILITDIRLPDCLGFDLIECAHAVNENTSIIIISGYDDFTYAQKALKAGALGYISKPVDLDEFRQIIETAKERCRQNVQNDLLNRRSFLTDILELRLTDEKEIEEKSKELNLASDSYYSIVIVELDTENPHFKLLDFSKQQDIYKEFSTAAEQRHADDFFLLSRTMQQYVYLAHAAKKDALPEMIREYHCLLKQKTQDNPAFSITAAYGRTIGSLTSLRKSFEDALSGLNFKFVIGSNSCIGHKDIGSLNETGMPDIENLNFSRLKDISITDKENLEQKLSEIHLHLRPLGRTSRSYASVLLEQIIFSISREVNQYDIALSDIFDSPVKEMQNILNAGDLKRMLDNFRTFFLSIASYVEQQQHNKYAKTINSALKFINEHLSDSSLNVNDVARHVYLSPGYFSLIFKTQTGETFSDYLIHLRIDKAKELIHNTNLKFYEVSYMVGYENVSHFNVIFKKYTGYTPSQYRRQVSLPPH